MWFAAALPSIADPGDRWNADLLLFGVPNGVVELRDGSLRDGRPEDRITLQAGAAFDPAATCPRWERFIVEIFAGDESLIRFIQRAIGYTLCGLTAEQCLFLLFGTGANGKMTLTRTIANVLGDYGLNLPFSTLRDARPSHDS